MKTSISLTAIVAMLLASASASAHDGETWIDRIDFKGDFRLRFDREAEDNQTDRERSRFRARFGFTAAVTDDIDFVLQLASGGDNPVSTNQSLDDGFSRKDIGVDLAYVDWTINDQFGLLAGKIKNPLFRAGSVPLVWDGDLNPEGAALVFSSGGLFATAAGFAACERRKAMVNAPTAPRMANRATPIRIMLVKVIRSAPNPLSRRRRCRPSRDTPS